VTVPALDARQPEEPGWLAKFLQAFHRIADAPDESRAVLPVVVSDLPLIELPVSPSSSDVVAVMLSGDGGWAGLDKEVAKELNARGIPVVGWDSLRYFWNARAPLGAARDLDRVIRHYSGAWHKSRVLVIGYSQGADTIPFMVNRLPEESRRLVRATALIAVSAEAFFEFHVTHWLGTPTGGLPTAPELADGRLGPVACIYGKDESDSPCQKFARPGFRAVALPGGHHFDGDYAGVAQAILSALPP
jgi:type IV secretory pathway VirJ component